MLKTKTKGDHYEHSLKNKLGMRSLHTQRLTRDDPCPVQVDKEVS